MQFTVGGVVQDNCIVFFLIFFGDRNNDPLKNIWENHIIKCKIIFSGDYTSYMLAV